MVTQIRSRSGRRAHLYIQEWMQDRGVSDEGLSKKLGVARETVTRYRSQQHRLNPEKIAAIADGLGVEPARLWRPPNANRPSIDELLREAPDDAVQKTAEIVAVLLKGGG